jgi:hypothetical protein
MKRFEFVVYNIFGANECLIIGTYQNARSSDAEAQQTRSSQ